MPKTFEVEVGGRILTFETGKMAGQASGAVFAKYGETGVLITAVGSDRLREGIDFLPSPWTTWRCRTRPVGYQGDFSGGKSGVQRKRDPDLPTD